MTKELYVGRQPPSFNLTLSLTTNSLLYVYSLLLVQWEEILGRRLPRGLANLLQAPMDLITLVDISIRVLMGRRRLIFQRTLAMEEDGGLLDMAAVVSAIPITCVAGMGERSKRRSRLSTSIFLQW